MGVNGRMRQRCIKSFECSELKIQKNQSIQCCWTVVVGGEVAHLHKHIHSQTLLLFENVKIFKYAFKICKFIFTWFISEQFKRKFKWKQLAHLQLRLKGHNSLDHQLHHIKCVSVNNCKSPVVIMTVQWCVVFTTCPIRWVLLVPPAVSLDM